MALTYRAVVLALLGLVPVAVWPQGDTVRWWWVAMLVLVGLDVLLAPSPRASPSTREGPGQVRLGEQTATSLLVTNTGRRGVRGPSATPGRRRQERRPRGIPSPSAPGERTRVDDHDDPTRRGDRAAHRVTVRSTGPLGLAARQRSFEVPGRLRTLHPFPARKHLPSRLAVLRQLDGRAALRTRGQGTEFDSLRDYVDGDDVRSIDWRATARRQHLVVRTWQPEQHRRIVIVVDTSRTSAGRVDDAPRLDAAMDAALLLTALAGHARDRVQVLAGDRVVLRGSAAPTAPSCCTTRSAPSRPIESRLIEADWGLLATEIGGSAPSVPSSCC